LIIHTNLGARGGSVRNACFGGANKKKGLTHEKKPDQKGAGTGKESKVQKATRSPRGGKKRRVTQLLQLEELQKIRSVYHGCKPVSNLAKGIKGGGDLIGKSEVKRHLKRKRYFQVNE